MGRLGRTRRQSVDRELYTLFNELMAGTKKQNPKTDNQVLSNLIGQVIDEKKLATKTDIAEVMWELKGIREENIVLADMKRQVNVHEDRIETIEEKLKIEPLAA